MPILPDVLSLARFGFIPEGMYNNLDFVSNKVVFDSGLKQEIKDLCCDPQTSGGLLLSLSYDDAIKVVNRINKPWCKIIGRVVEKKEKSVLFF